MAKHIFKVCEYCGARLDPGEHCDCRKAREEARPKPPIKTEEVKDK